MKISNAQLTLTENVAPATVECLARCSIELNALETAALANPFHPGFRVRCVLRAVDSNVTTAIFTYPRAIFIAGPGGLLNLSPQFSENLGADLLNEDLQGADEIRARFTLVDLSNGASISRNSPTVTINIA